MRAFYEIRPPREGLFARAWYTPVSDALRGELSGRLDVRRLIAAAGLPAPLPGLIYTVVRRSRLRRAERVDVARALVDHFHSQLATGRTASELLGEFGLPDQAANLIRQIKLAERRWLRRGSSEAQENGRSELIAIGLPAVLSGIIESVVRRSRLWRREKLDVARELSSHFGEGLAAGRTADELARDFGPADQAARLIRKAKIRNRSLTWHAWRFAWRSAVFLLLGIIVLYAALAARFYLATPTIAHNYWNDMNDARRAPEDKAAWPIYRQAIVLLGNPQDKAANPLLGYEWADGGPQGAHWSEIVRIVERYQPSIKLARQAAKMPRLGYLLGGDEDRKAFATAGASWLDVEPRQTPEKNQELTSAILTGVQQLRDLARLLLADARVASHVGDGARAYDDLMAVLSISEQLYQPQCFLIEQLVSFWVFDWMLRDLNTILADSPALLSDEQLRTLAHSIAAYRSGDIAIDYSSELITFDDLLQRAYTDDGRGNGRLTPAVLRWLAVGQPMGEPWTVVPNQETYAMLQACGPGLAAIVADRAEMRNFYHTFIDKITALNAGAPWARDAEAIRAAYAPFREESVERIGKMRFFLAQMMLPVKQAPFAAADRAIQLRDAAETAIALELWHRRHGEWPAQLDALVPALLPAVPVDRVDGQPLRYLLHDGRPVLYSLGADRDDDGGRPTADPNNAMPHEYGKLSTEMLQQVRQDPKFDGDWVLWPPALPEPAKTDLPASPDVESPAVP